MTQVHRTSHVGSQCYCVQDASLPRITKPSELDIVEHNMAGAADPEAQAVDGLRAAAREAFDIFAGDTLCHRLAKLPEGFWEILDYHAATDNFGIKQLIDDVLRVCCGQPPGAHRQRGMPSPPLLMRKPTGRKEWIAFASTCQTSYQAQLPGQGRVSKRKAGAQGIRDAQIGDVLSDT